MVPPAIQCGAAVNLRVGLPMLSTSKPSVQRTLMVLAAWIVGLLWCVADGADSKWSAAMKARMELGLGWFDAVMGLDGNSMVKLLRAEIRCTGC